jgi:hypothetical protein
MSNGISDELIPRYRWIKTRNLSNLVLIERVSKIIYFFKQACACRAFILWRICKLKIKGISTHFLSGAYSITFFVSPNSVPFNKSLSYTNLYSDWMFRSASADAAQMSIQLDTTPVKKADTFRLLHHNIPKPSSVSFP